MRKHLKSLAAISIALLCILGSLKLKVNETISEPTFVLFVAFSLLTGLFIAFSERIESLNLRSLDLKLKQVKDTEASVKEVARAILRVIESQSHGIMLESYDDEAAQKAIADLEKLIA